jgi:3-phenylpropionate/cinnamic acid dioxygenase small subunit
MRSTRKTAKNRNKTTPAKQGSTLRLTSKGPVCDEPLARLLLTQEISEFLYREAELLDERCYEEWLDLFTEDARYCMPLRRNVKSVELERENSSDLSGISWFDEGKETLTSRVRQIQTGVHWAEEPLSRVCHIVSNVQIVKTARPEVTVKSRMLVYRNRLQDETDFFVGKREDVLRKVNGHWKISRRKILLDQNVLLAKNITIFF